MSLLWQFAVVSLVVVAAIGLALAAVLGNTIRSQALHDTAADARDSLQGRALTHLAPVDLERPMTGERYRQFESFVRDSLLSSRTARIKIWNPEGTLVFSDEPAELGKNYPISEQLAGALQGRTTSELADESDPESRREAEVGALLEVYTPIVFPGSEEVAGAFEIYQFYAPVAAHIAETQHNLYVGLGAGLATLYVALFVVVKRGSDVIRRQQGDLEQRAEELRQSRSEMLLAMSAALDMRDVETQHHSLRVQQLALSLARELRLPPQELAVLETAALLHDVGKIGVPDRILRKVGPLSEGEWAVMHRHPELGYRLLRDFAYLRAAADIVYCHHEWYNGMGYPRGLKGNEIPLAARIFAVADTYDAMTSDRPYRHPRSHKEALDEIKRVAGTQFDSRVVKAFVLMMDRLRGTTAHAWQADQRVAA